MDGGVCVNVPHGFWEGGCLCREVWLRPIDTSDERFAAESTGQSPAERANQLLIRCTANGDERERVPVLDLTAGDREALLLHLRRISYSDRIEAVFACANQDCRERLEVALSTRDLLLEPYRDPAPLYERRIDGEISCTLTFRLPTAGDQAAVAHVARTDPQRAARLILERCVQKEEMGAPAVEWRTAPEPLFEQASALMAELDPQAEIEFDLQCPICGTRSSTPLDMATFLLQELDQRAEHLFRDIHTLAVWYHWSEEAILAMPQARRERYLDLIAAQTETA
jgi:hypothetical protein